MDHARFHHGRQCSRSALPGLSGFRFRSSVQRRQLAFLARVSRSASLATSRGLVGKSGALCLFVQLNIPVVRRYYERQMKYVTFWSSSRKISSRLSFLFCDPHICIFFTGPNYDSILAGTVRNCEFIACNGYSVRQLAKLAHSALPAESYRTYHPHSLNRQKLWDYIEAMRLLAYGIDRNPLMNRKNPLQTNTRL